MQPAASTWTFHDDRVQILTYCHVFPLLICLLFAVCVCFCALTGEVDKKASEKTVTVKPNKTASVVAHETADDQNAVKGTSVKAVKARSVRSKRRVKGEGKQAAGVLMGLILPACLESGSVWMSRAALALWLWTYS